MITGREVIRGLDASTVEIAGPLDLSLAASAFAVFSRNGKMQEFGAGGREFAASVAERLGIELDEEYSFRGHRLRTGRTSRYDPRSRAVEVVRIGVWEGDTHSVQAVVTGGEAADVITLFHEFDFHEDAAGVVVTPRVAGDPAWMISRDYPPTVAQPVPRLGLIEVAEMTRERARHVPLWGGQKVEGGELFLDDSTPQQPSLLLVGERTWTRIYPRGGTPEDVIVDMASALTVHWTTAA
ncbi:MAG TPA: hypothetical protein VHN37_11065 [Actinomycetota bacterium]|nr:hypothetical protein [Actinomycetota bacterium]